MELRNEKDNSKKRILLDTYCEIKENITSMITQERLEMNKEKFNKSRKMFWKEKKRISKNPTLESLTIKDNNGMRQYEPEAIKEHTALYYENLYKSKLFETQPYHNIGDEHASEPA